MILSEIFEARMGAKDFEKSKKTGRTLGFELEVVVDPDYERDFDSSDITELYVLNKNDMYLKELLSTAKIKPEAEVPMYVSQQKEIPYQRLKKAVVMSEGSPTDKIEKIKMLGFALNKLSTVSDDMVDKILSSYNKEAKSKIEELETIDFSKLQIQGTMGDVKLMRRDAIPWQYLSKVFVNGWEIMKKFTEYAKSRNWIDRDLTLETYDILEEYGIDDDKWRVIEDTSITPANCGRELVSVPFDYAEGVSELKNMLAIIRKEWITNSSCGIHVNVGSWKTEEEKNGVDLLKFMIFLDEDYVLNQFGRSKNAFSKPLFGKLKIVTNIVSDYGKNFEAFTKLYDENLQLINDAIVQWADHHDVVDFTKFKSGYLEIRAAGGRGYERREADILNLVNRIVRALELAEDPSASRNEYLKKVYALLKASDDDAQFNLDRSKVKPELEPLKKQLQKLNSLPSADNRPFVVQQIDWYTDKYKGLRNFLDRLVNFMYDTEISAKYKIVIREVLNEYKKLMKEADFDRTIVTFVSSLNTRDGVTNKTKKVLTSLLPVGSKDD